MIDYIIRVVSIGLVVLCMYLWGLSKDLATSIEEYKSQLSICIVNKTTIENFINTQNTKIAEYELRLKEVDAAYSELQKQPPEVRFKTVYKRIPSIEVKSDECKDLKKLIDDIRVVGY